MLRPATSQRRRPGKLASCTVDFVSREFPFPTIQPTTSPRRRRGRLLLPRPPLRPLFFSSRSQLATRPTFRQVASPHLPLTLNSHGRISRVLDSARSKIRDSLASIDGTQLNCVDTMSRWWMCQSYNCRTRNLFLLVLQKNGKVPVAREPPSLRISPDLALSYNKDV